MAEPSTTYALNGKTALVTGGSRGIGRSIALGLARSGADVTVNYRGAGDAAAEVAKEIERLGRKGLPLRADVTDPGAVDRMLQEAEAAMGPIEILVNNAGVLKRTPFLEISQDEWNWVLHTNLHAAFRVGQAVARRMITHGVRGRIINVSSTSAKLAGPNLTHYCVSKAGVTMLTKMMALELAPHGIQVNEVNPGLIASDMTRPYLQNDANRQMRLNRIPLKRVGEPEDIVGAVLFLASRDARLVTGASVYVDGGVTIW
jgi:NAD(P)-dependent dehydrogenase (short-subunit alcohol dehydrogenase family)